MEEDNIIFETMPDFGGLKINETDVRQIHENEKEYDSLYDELMDKCNPKKFSIKTFGYEKFNDANLIYSQILSLKSAPETDLITIRNLAIEKLCIHISTKKKYNELEEYLDPDQYVDNEDYNAELVSTVGMIYAEILSSQYDIRLLEEIESREIVKKIKEEYYAKKNNILIIQKEKEETEYFKNKLASDYLEKYPDGKYAEEAKDYYDLSWKKYLKKYPNGRYLEDAIESRIGLLMGFLLAIVVIILFILSI